MSQKILTENKQSITHLEHLSIEDFLDVIENIDDFVISEKVDGANLFFGIDEKGLYTYYGKSSRKVYDVTSYTKQFSTTYRRATHQALKRIEPVLRKHVKVGSEISLEVIFGKYPNVVPYTNDSNTIVFLYNTKGSTDLNALGQAVNELSSLVRLEDVPKTSDGKTIQYVSMNYSFEYSTVPNIQLNKQQKQFIHSYIQNDYAKLKQFLARRSGISNYTNKNILTMSMLSKPDDVPSGSWKSLKHEIKTKRKELQEQLKKNYYPPIKDAFLKIFVQGKISKFGSSDDWIEGVVIKHPYRDLTVKIVDRELFLGAKDFIWEIREKLFALPFSTQNVNSFRGKLLVSVCSVLGVPECGTIRSTSKIKSFGSEEKFLSSLTINDNTLNKIDMIVKSYNVILNTMLDKYINTYSKLNTTVKGISFSYDGEIHMRTLQVFADMFKELERIEAAIANDNNVEAAKEILKPMLNRAFGE